MPFTLISLREARDTGLSDAYYSVDMPWCFLFNTITRELIYIGPTHSPTSVIDLFCAG